MARPSTRALVVGDKVRVYFDGREVFREGVLNKLPTQQAPYWELIYCKPLRDDDEGRVCAFSGTVHVERLMVPRDE